MRQGVVTQLAAFEKRVHQREPGFRSVAHRDCHRAVELDHRRRLGAQQDIVQTDNLSPIGRRSIARIRVHGHDGGLQRVWAEVPRRQCALDKREPFGNLPPVPEPAILLVEQQYLPLRGRASLAPGIVQKHEREKSERLRFGEEIDQEPPEADCFTRQVVARERCT